MAKTQFTHKVIQGFSVVWTTFIVDGNGNPVVFAGTEPLSCEVWAGGSQAILFNPAVSFNTASAGSIDVTYSSLSTATVPQGFYDVLISRTDTTTALAFGYLAISPAPGSASADLISIPFARAALSDFALTSTQIEFLPSTITAASNAVKRWCGDRDFIQQTYVEEYSISLDGSIMLNQPPNWVSRIQASPSTAITIRNVSSSVQEAYVSANYTGDTSVGLTLVGLNLNSISNGTPTVTPVNFTAGMTIAALASAITAAGNGWTAYADTSYGSWAVSELIGLQVPGGAIAGSGAVYDVYRDDLGNDSRLDPTTTGLLWVGRQYKGSGPKWGPDWQEFESPNLSVGRVKVTYNAGFTTIPLLVQKCVANVAKNLLAVLSLDPTLASEKAEQYAYVAREAVELLPIQDRQALAFYRLHHA